MSRCHFAYVLIFSVVLLAFAITFERMGISTPTSAELRVAHQYGEINNKQTPPQPFRFDGCTLLPDQVFSSSFYTACLNHDIAYWYGGSDDERAVADQTLKEAIAEQGIAGTILHYPMYWMVRLFGDTFLLRPLNANWGFGYNES